MKNIISKKYKDDLTAVIDGNANKVNIKSNIHEELLDILLNTPDEVPEDGIEELVAKMYEDIVGLAFLEELLADENVEEINGNAWNDIEVIYRNGDVSKGDYSFLSPTQAFAIIQKIARISSDTLNDTNPRVGGYITTGVRFHATAPPVIDKEVGVIFSIRKQSKEIFTKADLVKFKTITEDAFRFLQLCFEHKVSVVCAGATSSGKTALLQALLKEISEKGKQRIYTIEEDTRELNLIHKKEGKIVSRVIHTKTRKNDNEAMNISSNDLLKDALRFHPDLIITSEARGDEALAAQEASRTGHGVGLTVHSSSAPRAVERIMTMCLMGNTLLDKDTLMGLIVEAFPIIVFQKQLTDRSRKVMEIFEVESYDIDKRAINGRTLFRYAVSDNKVDSEGRVIETVGSHIRENGISESLKRKLLENGATQKEVEYYERAVSL